MADNEDVNTLKRRGRRRLVGAIALVLAAVIVLPMVFDSEPRDSAPPVSVRIPAEDESGFAPKVAARVPAPSQKAVTRQQKAASAERGTTLPEPKSAASAPEKAAEKKAADAIPRVEKPAAKAPTAVAKAPETPAAAAAREQRRAEAALAGEQFIIPAGAYTDPSGVIEKLKAANVPYYTEPIATKRGTVTRVRAGPFANRDAAEKILKQLKEMGLKPGNVAARS